MLFKAISTLLFLLEDRNLLAVYEFFGRLLFQKNNTNWPNYTKNYG